jgi:hypothetical protein
MLLQSKTQWSIAGFVGVLAVAAGASAQTASGTATAGAGITADAQVGFQHPAQLTPQQEVEAADLSVSRMDQASGTISRMLEQARTARDVVKTLCLNDKLSQVDVAIRSAKDRKSALQAAAARNDQELSNHEFTILTVLRQRSEQLTAEANQCIGEEAAFIGATNVSTTIDNTLPPPDDDTQPIDTSTGSAPPDPASSDM